MARSVGRYRQLHCHSCDRRWGQVVWSYSNDVPDDRRTSITCTCPTPHVELLPTLSDSVYAVCRAEQRAVVYVMPDGKVLTPFTNSYEDDTAKYAVARGGYRHEFERVDSMRRFQQHMARMRGFDPSDPKSEHVERSRVIDWDQASIRNHVRDAAGEMADQQTRAIQQIIEDGGIASGKGLDYYASVMERKFGRDWERHLSGE